MKVKILLITVGLVLVRVPAWALFIQKDLNLPQSNILKVDAASSQSSYIRGSSFGYGWY